MYAKAGRGNIGQHSPADGVFPCAGHTVFPSMPDCWASVDAFLRDNTAILVKLAGNREEDFADLDQESMNRREAERNIESVVPSALDAIDAT